VQYICVTFVTAGVTYHSSTSCLVFEWVERCENCMEKNQVEVAAHLLSRLFVKVLLSAQKFEYYTSGTEKLLQLPTFEWKKAPK